MQKRDNVEIMVKTPGKKRTVGTDEACKGGKGPRRSTSLALSREQNERKENDGGKRRFGGWDGVIKPFKG